MSTPNSRPKKPRVKRFTTAIDTGNKTPVHLHDTHNTVVLCNKGDDLQAVRDKYNHLVRDGRSLQTKPAEDSHTFKAGKAFENDITE